MAHPLDGARTKLERARSHLADAQTHVAAYIATRPIKVDEHDERDDNNKRHIVWVATADTDPPAELGVIVGDWAHNVRAALDYTVYEVVRRETGEDDPRWTQFPVVVAEPPYAAQEEQRLRGAPAWSLPVFRGLQPFNEDADAEWHPLAILADVSNRDKHRLVHTAGMQIAGSQARVSGTSLMAIRRLGQNPGTVERERVIFEAVIETDSDDFEIQLDLELNVSLEGYELPIAGLMGVITDEASAIVDWFAPALD